MNCRNTQSEYFAQQARVEVYFCLDTTECMFYNLVKEHDPIIFLVGQLRRPRRSAGNANRYTPRAASTGQQQ